MNNIIAQNPAVGARNGQWVWDGSRWICDPDCDFDGGRPFGPPVFSGPTNQPPWYPGANGGVSFGSVPPPNPVRGHFWWNGTALMMFDGAAWVSIAGGGNVTPPQTSFPPNPQPGQQAFVNGILYVWDGNAWIPTSQTKTYVQATAPPAPNPGDLWFDGTQLHIWTGSAWDLVGPGATVGPVPTTTKVFEMHSPNVSISNVVSAYHIVPFATTPNIDTLNGWNAGSNQYKPTKAGTYAFYTMQSFGSPETNAGHALLLNDGGVFTGLNAMRVICGDAGYATPAGTAQFWLPGSGMVVMNGSTDFVRLWAYADDGTFQTIGNNTAVIRGFLMP